METNELTQLGKNIKVLRVKAGLSQMDFAEKMELHLNSVSLMERGRTNVPFMQLIKMAKVLDCKVTAFFKGL